MGLLRLKKHRTLLFHTSTQVYACVFGCLFGQNSIFLQFSGAKSALLSQPKAKLLPSVPRTSFLEPCSCFLQHFSQSFPGSAEHKCSKPRKTPKNAKLGFSHASAIFFAEKHFVGCRYIYNKTLLTCTKIPRRKRCIFKIFTDHEPFERRVRSQGVHLHHAFSPHPDQIETRGLDH